MGFFSSLFGKTSTPVDFEQAKVAREAFLATVASSPESDAFNAASALMLDKQFDDTIAAYTQLAARAHGADASMMDDNIWEACEALHGKGDPSAAGRYLELCPDGAYTKQAKKLAG